MNILLLNLLDSIITGSSMFVFFQAFLGKNRLKLPYYLILFLYISVSIAYTFLSYALNGNTSVSATMIRIGTCIIISFILCLLFNTNLRTRLLLSIIYPILTALFENFSYYIITSIYSYQVTENTMDTLVFSSISLTASLFMFFFYMLIHLIWK